MNTFEALEAVKDGADVYAYGLAMKLREIERTSPELITICKAMNPPKDGAKQQPYFGAICTSAGREFLENHHGEVSS